MIQLSAASCTTRAEPTRIERVWPLSASVTVLLEAAIETVVGVVSLVSRVAGELLLGFVMGARSKEVVAVEVVGAKVDSCPRLVVVSG